MNTLGSDLARMKQLLDRKSIDLERDRRNSPFLKMFSDTGPGRRELYPKQIDFFGAGLLYKERLFMAANRVGKTVAGAFETTCHLTGRYPIWWEGRRLLCGDATDPQAVSRLLDDQKPFLMVVDPPYGIELDSEWRDRANLNKRGPAEPS